MKKFDINEIKLPIETSTEIEIGVGEEQLKELFLSEEDFIGLDKPLYKKKEVESETFLEIYRNLCEILKMYCDWKEEYYPIVACWIIGTYFHSQMLTYPYLYFNASKQSGKTRSVNLITYLSKGEMVNSMTEAVLFRTKGTLGIDEFERGSRKGNENLIELLNSAYKKGVTVKRMKKVKTPTGEEQIVENFEVFRPIVLANIWGLDFVLEDRTLPLYLEKTEKSVVSSLMELWEFDSKVHRTLEIIEEKCSLCSVVMLQEVYVDWNDYIINNYTTSRTNNYTKLHLFEKIKNSGLKGRMLELSFPLILIADMIEEEVVDTLISSLKIINLEKNQEEFLENKDILLLDMVSQEIDTGFFQSIKVITEKFRQFAQTGEEWLNEKWVGRAIKRLGIAKEKKRTNKGIEILLDVLKARDKIRIFK